MKSRRKRLRSSKINENRKEKEEDSPNFLLKLYQILNTPEFINIIHWSDNGKYLIVQNLFDFTEKVLPQYYKHHNYSSFVRQLNMYDFHKKRSNQNKHVFQHKLFINGQKELIKTIKRKNKKDYSINNENEQALVEYFNEDNCSKKATKTNLEKALNYLLKSVKESNDKQNELEHKVEKLGKQNEDFLVQNEQMLQEIISKTEYTKNLEVVVYYILEMTMKKSTIKGNSEAKGVLLENNQLKEDESNILKHIDDNYIQDIIPKTSLVKIDSPNQDSLKAFLDKYIQETNLCSSVLNKNKNELPMLLTNGEELQTVNYFNNIKDDNNNTVNHQMQIKPPSSPLCCNYSNLSLSPKRYSPHSRMRMRKSSHDSAISMQIEDKLFKNTALRKIITNTIHSNQNILLKQDNDQGNNIPSLNDSIMNSIHSRNIFDLDFNFEDSEHSGIQLDKKIANRSFFEYDT